MGLTVGDVRATSSAEPLSRLTELADVVLEAAQLLQATAAAARAPAAGGPRPELIGALFADLLGTEVLDGREVVRRAGELGCDVTLGALVVCVELRVPRPAYVEALIADGCQEALIHSASGRVYAILPCVGTCIAGSIGAVRRLAERIAPYGLVGVSSFQAEASELGRAAREAELVVEVIRCSGESTAAEVGSGTYRLLLRMLACHPTEVREFYEATIAPMVAYDEHNGTELVLTLRAYLDGDCNMNTTAAAVYAHRHTVAARLERIRELTGLDPLHYEQREQLGLGLKVYRLLAPQLDGRAGAPA